MCCHKEYSNAIMPKNAWCCRSNKSHKQSLIHHHKKRSLYAIPHQIYPSGFFKHRST
jgi:hypothetical protein